MLIRQHAQISPTVADGPATSGEIIIVMTAIIMAAGTFTYQLSGQNPADVHILTLATQTSPMIQLVRAGAYLTIIGICARSYQNIFALVKHAFPVVILVILAVASAIWSPDPSATLRKAVAFSLTLFTGFCLVGHYGGIGALKLLVRTFVAIIFLSILMVFVFPEYGSHQVTDAVESTHAGQWRGLFVHRTLLGQLAGLTGAFLITFGRDLIRSNVIRLLAIAASLLCLIEADSGGGFLTFALLIMSYYIITKWQSITNRTHRGLYLGIGLIAIIATLVFFGYFYDLALSILGKSDTLTGRTRIWSLLTSLWLQRPALGYGFASGFSNRLLPQLSVLLNIQYVANAQNGYLQILITLGYVGFSVLFWTLYVALKGSARLALEKAGILVMPLLISIYFLEVNVVEAWFTEEHNPSLMLFSVALATAVSRNLRKSPHAPARVEFPATRWQIG